MPTGDPQTLPPLSRDAAKNTIVVFFGQAISLAANAAATVILARYLGQAGFGLFSYAIVFVSLFAILPDFGMQPILVREISRNQWKPAEMLGNAVLVKSALSFAAIALIIFTAWIVGQPQELFVVIVILAFNILVTSKLATVRVVFEAPFHASLKMEVPMLCQLLDGLLLLGTLYILSQYEASLEMLVLAYVLTNLPGLCLTVLAFLRRAPLQLSINRGLVLFLIRESFPLWIYTILMTFYNSVDVLMLKEFQGENAVGIYSAALRLTSPLLFIPNGIVASLFPLLSRYHQESREKLNTAFGLGMKIILIVALALAIAATFLGPKVIYLLYSNEYSASTGPLIILMWAQAFLFLNFFFTSTLTSVNLQRITFHAAASMFFVNAVCSWILIPELGSQGAAFAKLIATISGFVILLAAIKRTFVLPIKQLALRTAVFGIFFTTGLALLRPLHLGGGLAAAFGIFVLVTIISGVFDEGERAILKSLMPVSILRK